jgi:acetyl-CoA acetyltransferase
MTTQAFICDAIRTPIGRYGGTLAGIRTDDLAALPIKALMARNPGVDWKQVEDVIYGCANQAGEDNRNVARMALPAGRAAGGCAGRHHQPAVRFRHGCGGHGGTRDQGRRGGIDDCRRRRKHEPRALRHAKSGERLFAQQCGV